MAERDYQKYQRLYKNNQPHHVSVDDLLAIQQIEIDRGNYNRNDVIVFGDKKQLQEWSLFRWSKQRD